MTTPLVSIVIPTYNRPRLLAEAIASALAQTHRHLEVIVSENAGPEVSAAVCRSFGDDRVRFRRNDANLGIAGNVREASKEARGRFIAHLCDDDLLEPGFVETLLPALLAHPEVVVSFGDHHVVDAAGNRDVSTTEHWRRRWKRDRLAAGIHQPFLRIALVDRSVPPTCLIRNDAIRWDELRSESGSPYDWYMWYLLGRDGAAASYLPAPVFRYRLHGGQETAARVRMGEGWLYSMRAVVADPRVAAIRPEIDRMLTTTLIFHGTALVRDGRRAEARAVLREALARGAPATTWARVLLSYAPWALAMRDRLVHGRR